MPLFLRTKSFRIIAGVALFLALYAIAGFVVAPRLVRSALLEDIPKTIGVTPAVGLIHINPFLFQVTVDDFSLAGAGGEKLLGFRRLFVDFELSSIWHRAYSFGSIDITSPYVSAVMAKDGSLNLLQLRPKPPSQPKPEEQRQPIPAIRIGSLKVSQGLVTYQDRSRPDVFAARLEPINFELREFKTGVEGGKFTFTGSSKLGERIEWHGHLSVQPIESDGEFRVDGLLAHTVWEYLQDQLNFDIPSGTIDLAATYRFSLRDGAADNLQVDVSKVQLSDLTVRPKDSETEKTEPAAPWITVPVLAVTGTTVDLSQRRAHVDLVSLTGVKLVTWLDPDGTLNLMKFAAAPPGAAKVAPAASTAPATPSAPTSPVAATSAPPPAPSLTATGGAPGATAPPWTFDVRQFDLRDASVSVEDRTTRPAVKVLLAPFSIQVNGASQDLTKPVSVTIDTHVNEKGSLTVSGEITPRPLTANLGLKLADMDLTMVQPYIAQHTAMTLQSGKLGVEGKLRYSTQTQPAVQFLGDVNVEKLHTVDDALQDDFINWDRLDIRGLSYSQGPDRLDIDEITARKLYARVIIEPDASVNVKRVLKIPPAAAPGTAAAKMSSTAAAPPGSSPIAAAPAVDPDAAKLETAAGRHGKAARAGSRSAATAPATQSMPMAIKKIVVDASQANFSDLSVAPNFSTGIQKLAGTVVGLSSKPGSRAKVDLKGSVDTFSPVSITGDVNVLGPLYIDLLMSFRNISLPVFDPYSGKFAGYDIAKGKLTTELHYKVDGRKLDAQHHIVIEQLEFGDKTASKEAVSLPIKLAVSLLKDRNGVIDLNFPVTGSLDDPQFRLAPLIWKVFLNILEKAVTAPFELLGALFGSGPEIKFIDFQPGVGTLDAAALDKVKTVAKALAERPQLKIDIPIAVVPDVDRPALVAAQFNAEVGAEQGSKGSPKKASATATGSGVPPPDQLDPTTQLELLLRLYKKDFATEPKFPDAVTGLKSKSDITSAKIDFLGNAIREHIVIGDDTLKALGQRRAQALQQALLVEPEVTPERVFLVANDKATAEDGVVRLELSLE